MARAVTLQLDDDLYSLLTRAARAEGYSPLAFIDTAIRERLRERAPELVAAPASRGAATKPPRNARRRTLDRLFELFEGNDAQTEVRRLKEQDEWF
jgi:hypothetical protein